MSSNPYTPLLGPRVGGYTQLDTDLQQINLSLNRLITAVMDLVTALTTPAKAIVGTAAEQAALVNPATGLLFFNTTAAHLQTNTGTPGSPVWSNP